LHGQLPNRTVAPLNSKIGDPEVEAWSLKGEVLRSEGKEPNLEVNVSGSEVGVSSSNGEVSSLEGEVPGLEVNDLRS
jgi:hypothetical protein